MGNKCDRCGITCRVGKTVEFNAGNYQSTETLCINCCSVAIDDLYDSLVEKNALPYITLYDYEEVAHRFEIKIIRYGLKTVLQANEVSKCNNAGYSFKVKQGSENSDKTGVYKLLEEAINGLKKIKKQDVKEQEKIEGIAEVIEGKIEWADSSGDLEIPKFKIDNREYTLEEFGNMLMTYEGYNFRLEIKE